MKHPSTPSKSNTAINSMQKDLRKNFPGLNSTTTHFDGPGGAQVTKQTLKYINDYLVNAFANDHGEFNKSKQTENIIANTRARSKTFFGASNDFEIIFGPNATSLFFQLSETLIASISDCHSEAEIILCEMDHSSNIDSWLIYAKKYNLKIKWWKFNPEIDAPSINELKKLLSSKTKLVAFTAASNVIGTVMPIKQISDLVREYSSAYTVVDAVHFAPHFPIQQEKWNVDFTIVSAFKFGGPHLGILCAKKESLKNLRPPQVLHVKDLPSSWERGSLSTENIAGLYGALDYWFQVEKNNAFINTIENQSDLRKKLEDHYLEIEQTEHDLFAYLSQRILEIPFHPKGFNLKTHIKRTPTISFKLKGTHRHWNKVFFKNNLACWEGDFYAPRLVKALGEDSLFRWGLLHYNTKTEIEWAIELIKKNLI